MTIYKITKGILNKLAPLFADWPETLIWSVLQGAMGSAWADSEEEPKSAQAVIADFCFFAGEPSKELVRNFTGNPAGFCIMVPQNEAWAHMIESVYGGAAGRRVRYAIKKEGDIFDRKKLKRLTEQLPSGYELKMIDRELFELSGKQQWSRDLCAQFENYEDYRERGLGAAVIFGGTLVAGASSYTVYNGGIEIEIDTREDHRRKGLAAACGARLILECLERGLYPSWDAQNLWSVALAEKLGYHFDKEYTVYEVAGA